MERRPLTSVALDGDGPGQSSDRAGGGAERRSAGDAGPAGADQILALQRTAGNQAVGRMLAREPEPQPATAAEPVELGRHDDRRRTPRARARSSTGALELEAESKALDAGGIPAPVSVETTRAAGLKHAQTLATAAEPLDAELLRTWYADFVKAMNAARSAQAAEAAERARRSADEVEAANDSWRRSSPSCVTSSASGSGTATRTACWRPPTRSRTCSTPGSRPRRRSTS